MLCLEGYMAMVVTSVIYIPCSWVGLALIIVCLSLGILLVFIYCINFSNYCAFA